MGKPIRDKVKATPIADASASSGALSCRILNTINVGYALLPLRSP